LCRQERMFLGATSSHVATPEGLNVGGGLGLRSHAPVQPCLGKSAVRLNCVTLPAISPYRMFRRCFRLLCVILCAVYGATPSCPMACGSLSRCRVPCCCVGSRIAWNR